MGTRTRKIWKPNARGYYERQIGWATTKSGKLQQPKFLLGKVLKEAQRREWKIRELWEQFEQTQQDNRPAWPPGLLEVAKKVAKGVSQVEVPRKPGEFQTTYADRIRRVQAQYPVIAYVPADPHAYEVGQEALQVLDSLPEFGGPELISARATNEDVMRTWQMAESLLDEIDLGPRSDSLTISHSTPKTAKATVKSETSASTDRLVPHLPAQTNGATSRPGSTLHVAMKGYIHWIEKEFFDESLGRLSAWGRTQVRQMNTLLKHHANLLLERLDQDAVEEMFRYWRSRPVRKKTKRPTSRKSASNYVSQLQRFLKWLHRTSRYDWRKPEGFEDIDFRVRALPTDHQKQLEQVDTFSLDELVLLMRYSHPMERLLLLLGLNCGFGAIEIATLLVGEAHLHKAHSSRHQEMLGIETTDADSFIKRVRRKNSVYGEFILFPQTAQGIEWALERRKKQPSFAKDARLLLNDKGEPFDKPTKGGNRNQQIPNYFDRLQQRAIDDDNKLTKLSFGKLRKTAGSLIRRFSDGEIAGVFLCHGQAVRTDDLADVYTNRPFGKVFQAIRAMQEYLAPVFATCGPRPFDPQPQAYTSRSTIDRIVQLHSEGYPTGQIAKAVGVSGDTASRHIVRHIQEVEAATPNR